MRQTASEQARGRAESDARVGCDVKVRVEVVASERWKESGDSVKEELALLRGCCIDTAGGRYTLFCPIIE